MKLEQVKQAIRAIPLQKELTVTGDVFGVPYIIESMLYDCFGITGENKLVLSDLSRDDTCTYIRGSAGNLTFLGSPFQNMYIKLQFSETNTVLYLTAQMEIKDAFNPFAMLSDQFEIVCDGFAAEINDDYKKAFAIVNGCVKIGATVNLPVEITHLYGSGSWTILSRRLSGEHNLDLDDILDLTGISDMRKILPDEAVSVLVDISVREIQTDILIDDAQSNGFSISYFRLDIDIARDKKWTVMDSISVSGIGVLFNVRYRDYAGNASLDADITFSGTFEFASVDLPVSVAVGADGVLRLLAEKDDGVRLGGIADLAQFIGHTDLGSMLPAGYNYGELYLDSMYLEICGASLISAFEVSLHFSAAWSILNIFTIEKLGFHYSMSQNDGEKKHSFMLTGEMELLKGVFHVMLQRTEEGFWNISGETAVGSIISVSGLVNGLCRLFGMDDIPMPDFQLKGVLLCYSSEDDSFRILASAYVKDVTEDFLRFESISASLDVTWRKKYGKWQCEGTIAGWAEMLASLFKLYFEFGKQSSLLVLEWEPDEALVINDLFKMIGFQMPETLDVSVKSMKINYIFGQKSALLLDAASGEGGKLWLKSEIENAARQYIFAALIKQDFNAKALPVVGSLDVLSAIYLHDIQLFAATCDVRGLTIDDFVTDFSMKKGFYAASELHLPDKAIPLALPMPSGADSYAAANSDANNTGAVIKIEKAIGPFHLKAIRLSLSDGAFGFGLDAAFQQSMLAFNLEGLGIKYGLSSHNVQFSLSGLGVMLDAKTFTISGSLLKSAEDAYAGSLLVHTPAFTLTAIGSYAKINSLPSVFAFALLRAQIGGPPCFFITGVAVGFGYNRKLEIPGINKLSEFPLIKAADGGMSMKQILDDEQNIFKPTESANWAAAGITFNSFKMIDSFALLTVAWGGDFEINLLGRSVLNVPFDKNTPNPIAHAVLLLKASFKPASSLVAVDALLSNESYVLSKDCHLTGSFAFYTWYGGTHKGDFVLTLGGYHARYKKPAHYPDAVRLGLKWNISKSLTAQGSLYFALTPSCVMAGGTLKLVYSSGRVRAWFDAYLDVLIQWKPYHYDFQLGIYLGVHVDLSLFSVNLELGCDLHVWGPEFSGKARVKLWCITFTISFGSTPQNAGKSLTAQEFKESFLPSDTGSSFGGCAVNAINGLVKENQAENGSKVWVMCAETFRIVTKSAVPSDTLKYNGEDVSAGNQNIVARPCDDKPVISTHNVVLVRTDKAEIKNHFTCTPVIENVPAALWLKKTESGETILACTGMVISAVPAEYYTLAFSISSFLSTDERRFADPPVLPSKRYNQEETYSYLSRINDASTTAARAGILRSLGSDFQNVRLDTLAQNPEGVFCTRPMLASIGNN